MSENKLDINCNPGHARHLNIFDEFLEEASGILERGEEECPYGIMYLDITDFKVINDFYGYEEGDRMLEAVEGFLKCFPGMRACKRVFSDHFIGLFQYKNEAVLKQEYEEAVKSFLRLQRSFHFKCKPSIIAGAAFVAKEKDALLQAIDRANIARKKAKSKGKTTLIWCDREMLEKFQERKIWEVKLQEALEKKSFTFYLQPKVDLTTGIVVGAEALARGIGEENTIWYPNEFLSILEERGDIVRLDWMMLEQVCLYIQGALAEKRTIVPISLNWSGAHMNYGNVAAMIARMVSSYGIDPCLLEFELTEAMLSNDFDSARRIMEQLHEYGFKTSVGDFGCGYAGVTIWQDLPFDMLKLDRQFVTDNDIMKSRNDIILTHISEISEDLRTTLLCEGVETLEHCRHLKDMGCRLAQGDFFSLPVPVKEFEQILQQGPYKLPWANNIEPQLSLEKEEAKEQRESEAALKEPVTGEIGHLRVRHILELVLLLLGLGLLMYSTFYRYQNQLEEKFNTLVEQNINAYAETQQAEVEGFYESVTGTLSAIKSLIESGGIDTKAREFNDYLREISEKQEGFSVEYTSAGELQKEMELGNSTPIDEKEYEFLTGERTLISEVHYSAKENQYFYSIAMPVQIDGSLSGVVSSKIEGERLLLTSQAASKIDIQRSILVKSDGSIIPTSTSDKGFNETIRQELEYKKISEDFINQIESALKEPGGIRTLRIGDSRDLGAFVSITSLGYNDWYVMNFSEVNTMQSYSNEIMKQTVKVAVLLIVLMLILGVAVIAWLYRKQLRERFENEKYAVLAQFSDTMLVEYDYLRDTMAVTPNAKDIFRIDEIEKKGYLQKKESLLGIHNSDFALFRDIIMNPNDDERIHRENIRLWGRAGNEIWCSLQYRYLYEGKQPTALIGKITDISRQMKREEHLLERSSIDGLTGLLNKTFCESKAMEYVRKGVPGILVLLDVDNFKNINDSGGHAYGDEVLSTLGDILKNAFRSGDLIGRIGGDEFMVYMSNTDNLEVAKRRAASVINQLNSYSKEHADRISVSMGIAANPIHADTYEELFSQADKAMYCGKKKGKNQYCIAQEKKAETE